MTFVSSRSPNPVCSSYSSSPGRWLRRRPVVLRYFREVLDAAKVEALDELVEPGCAIHRPEGELKGLTALRAMVAGRRSSFTSFRSQIDDIFEAGDRVVVRLQHQGVEKGSYRFRTGLNNIEGKVVTWSAIVIFRMHNGKIAEEWVSRDELGMLLSAGVLKAGAPAPK